MQHIQVIETWSSKLSCCDRNHKQSSLGGRHCGGSEGALDAVMQSSLGGRHWKDLKGLWDAVI